MPLIVNSFHHPDIGINDFKINKCHDRDILSCLVQSHDNQSYFDSVALDRGLIGFQLVQYFQFSGSSNIPTPASGSSEMSKVLNLILVYPLGYARLDFAARTIVLKPLSFGSG